MQYQGGKNGAGVYQTIINHIPRHQHYVEAFAGSAAVYRHKAPAVTSTLIEASSEQAQKLSSIAGPGAYVINADALAILPYLVQRHPLAMFVYLDPPYHPSARRDLDLYTHELTAAQHHELLHSLLPMMTDRGIMWALSGYRCKAYDDAAAEHGWRRVDYQAMTRRGVVTESLWMNYAPESITLHDYRYLGADFRERERIQRKVKRWAGKLAALPLHERRAILASLAKSGEGI